MTTPTGPVLELSDVSKDYRGLRPLRIAELTVQPGEHIAIIGLDQTTAEVFVNLVTGATLPDRGDVRLFGRPTSAITDSADWLAVVDRFGIVSPRAVLLDSLTVVQNLAMPFTLDIEPPAEDIRRRAVALAERSGARRRVARPARGGACARRARARPAGPCAGPRPGVVILEHPTAEMPRGSRGRAGGAVPDDRRGDHRPDGGRRVRRGRGGSVPDARPRHGRLAQRAGWLSRLLRG